MTKQNYLFLLLLSLVAHTHLQAAQMNVEVKEQEKKQLSAEEQAAADRMFEIIHATNKDNAAQQAQALQKLLKKYPKIVHAKNNHSETALMLAGSRGLTKTAKLLIAAGANLNIQDNYGNTALMLAAQWGEPETVELLIAAGADETIQNEKKDRMTAQDYAARNDFAVSALSNRHQEAYDAAVIRGKRKQEQYEHAQQLAKKKITEVMFPEEIEEPEITEIIGEYAYNPAIPADLPEETKHIKQQV